MSTSKVASLESKYSIEKFKNIYEKEDNYILSLLEDREGVQVSPYGFYYEVLDGRSTGGFPKTRGEVKIQIEVFALSGDVIYHSRDFSFFLDRSPEVIRGMNEGVKLMKVGQVFRFYFTSFQAYGIWGDGDKILPNMPLIYKTKLLSFNEDNN